MDRLSYGDMARCPTVDARGEWRGGELWWVICGEDVRDADLKAWCAQHIESPWCYADVIRECHTRAWSWYHVPAKVASR